MFTVFYKAVAFFFFLQWGQLSRMIRFRGTQHTQWTKLRQWAKHCGVLEKPCKACALNAHGDALEGLGKFVHPYFPFYLHPKCT